VYAEAPNADVRAHAQAQLAQLMLECMALLWDLTTDLRAYVQAHASRWGTHAAAWFEALYVAGRSEAAMARQSQVSREHVHRTVRKILLDPALIVWLEDYFARRLGCPLQDALRALETRDSRRGIASIRIPWGRRCVRPLPAPWRSPEC
jgi:hypothetical protein